MLSVEEKKRRRAACQKVWYAANREEVRARSKAYYAANKGQIAAQRKALYAENPEKYAANQRRTKYNMSPADYDALWLTQSGRCVICRTEHPGGNAKRLVVDHDHATGKVRGLLCTHCNHMLGEAKDSPETLCNAASYLSPSILTLT